MGKGPTIGDASTKQQTATRQSSGDNSGSRRQVWLIVLGTLAVGAVLIAYGIYGSAPQWAQGPPGMKWIPGGEFDMGSEEPMFRDARPVHRVAVDGFWMDETEVTNAQFAEFVQTTGYVTVAERAPRAEDYPGAPPENLVAGSVVFTAPSQPVPLDNHFRW